MTEYPVSDRFKVTLNGIDLSKWINVSDVQRNVGQNRKAALVKVGKTDGKLFQYTTADEGTITIKGDLDGDSRVALADKRHQLADAITTSSLAKLWFEDEPNTYYLAISDGQAVATEDQFLGEVTITFSVPDGIAHSVATQTADNMPYKDVPVNLLTGTSNQVVQANSWNMQVADIKYDKSLGEALCASVMINNAAHADILLRGNASIALVTFDSSGNKLAAASGNSVSYNANGLSWCSISIDDNTTDVKAYIFTNNMNVNAFYSCLKIEKGTTASPWSPNPADPEYYSDTITVPNSGTYPVYPVIEATMHSENGLVAFANDQGGVLQFGDPEEVDGVTKTRAEQVLRVGFDSDPGGTANNASGATNYPNYKGVTGEVNKRIGSMQFVKDSLGGTSMQPVFDNAGQNYWAGPSRELPIKDNSAGVNTGNCWTVVRVQFDTSSKARGRLEYTLCNGSNVVMSIVLRDSTSAGDQMAMECWNQGTLLTTINLDRKVFKNGRYFQLKLYRFSARIGFQIAPVTSVNSTTDSATLGKAVLKEYQITNHVPITSASIWFERWKQTQHTIMGVSDLLFSWTDVDYWTDLANRFSDGDVVTADVANKAILVNGVEDMTLHTVGNTWDKFMLQPGENTIQTIGSSWCTTPLEVSVQYREAYY